MSVSRWSDSKMITIAVEILAIEPKKENQGFGYPFLTPYQIAVEYKRRYPEDFQRLGLNVGGRGTSDFNSLSQFFSRMLTKHVRDKMEPKIEKRYLHRKHISKLVLTDDGEKFEPSSSQDTYLSIFRLV